MTSGDPKKLKCCYIVSESACLDENTGAGIHIRTGVEQLSREFEVQLTLFCEPPAEQVESGAIIRDRPAWEKTLRKIYGRWMRWWIILAGNLVDLKSGYVKIKKANPAIIYERAAYLNFNGLIISRMLRIPHYYEVNGLFFKDNSFRFPALYNFLSKKLEVWAYRSTRCFFVGGLNGEIDIENGKRAHVIQNGIDEKFLKLPATGNHSNRPSDGLLNIVFVGHLMTHHGLKILLDALGSMKHADRVVLNLIGSNFEKLKMDESSRFITVNHGVLKDEKLLAALQNMDVGIVPFALDYYSNMKLFLYAAMRLVIVIPRAKNFERIFNADEVIYFQNENTAELSAVLDELVISRDRFNEMPGKAFSKVKDNFTWPIIFDNIIHVMKAR